MNLNQKNFFNYYTNVESYYDEHVDVLSNLTLKMSNDFNISQNIFESVVKRALAEVLAGGPKDFLCTKKVPIKHKVFYYLVMSLFLINIFFGKKNKKPIQKKIIFDCWNFAGYKNFYKPLLNLLNKNDVLLHVTNYHNLFKEINSNIAKIHSNKYLFDSNISKKIIKTQAFSLKYYSNLSNQLNVNFVYLVLRIFKNIALHVTTAKQINCYMFFSARDNNFDSLRSYIYKKNGIQNIALLQNGTRTGEWANEAAELYTFCDFYFGFGVEQIAIQKGMVCKNKMSVGSIKLDSILKEYKNYNKKEHYDIAFLASYDEDDSNFFKFKTYEIIINNLCLFKKNHPNLNVYYSQKLPIVKSDKYNLLVSKIKLSGILCSSKNIKNSYEAIYSSSVVLFYKTTIGHEALAINSKVLNLNYDKDMVPFSHHSYYAVLTNSSYDEFESRLLFLLDSKINDIEYEAQDLVLNYMNNSSNLNLPKEILETSFKNYI